MRTLQLLVAAFAVVSFVVLGSVSVYAQAEALNCDQAFKTYSGGKDYMNQQDFEQYWVDSGQGHGSTMNPEIGGSGSAFNGANPSRSGMLSKSEFCDWARSNP